MKNRTINFIRPTYAGDGAGRALSVLRIATGILFLTHPIVKLFGFPAGAQPGRVPLDSLFGAAGLIELVGSLLLILGLFTEPVAFLLSGEMAIAYFTIHAPQSFLPQLNGGEAAIYYCFTFLCVSIAGPGPWSMDAVRTRSKG